MKLSEAIRLGAMLGPQVCGSLDRLVMRLNGMEPEYVKGYCALGAAIAAGIGREGYVRVSPGEILGGPRSPKETVTREQWISTVFYPAEIFQILDAPSTCPQCGKQDMWVSAAIAHLNDEHCWTRERIADFVERVEHEQAAEEMRRQLPMTEPVGDCDCDDCQRLRCMETASQPITEDVE